MFTFFLYGLLFYIGRTFYYILSKKFYPYFELNMYLLSSDVVIFYLHVMCLVLSGTELTCQVVVFSNVMVDHQVNHFSVNMRSFTKSIYPLDHLCLFGETGLFFVRF